MDKNYLQDSSENALFNYKRRETVTVRIGDLEMGSDFPVRIQSMANTDTNDTEASVAQALRIAQAGGELVRFTAQGVKEATNLAAIHDGVRKGGSNVPLVADIHFNPRAAEEAALHVEKVRVNPGNFVDRVHTLQRFDYTDEEYALELEKIRMRLLPLLAICREHKTALRIGVNHGSLSDRILSRYGDTSEGMVESCMEFLRICKAEGFNDVVISIKASNTVIMVQTVRLLAATMREEGMAYPLHLGVTEAGDGEDGRVKSAVGIGALLADGLGDTIRVSLSEAPECEIPVARKLVDYINLRKEHPLIKGRVFSSFNPYSYQRRETIKIGSIGGSQEPVVIAMADSEKFATRPDFVFKSNRVGDMPLVKDYRELKSILGEKVLEITYSEYNDSVKGALDDKTVLVLTTSHLNGVGELRAFFHALMNDGVKNPVIIKRHYDDSDWEDFQIKVGADFGLFFIDGLGDGVWIDAPNLPQERVLSVSFGVLQAARARISKTEYISCPSCGRTLFDLQSTIAAIKARTSHLKGLKIGIMGCIVNGPGEMADADYGYVGSGRGQVNLYKGQTCIEKLIPAEEAVERLIQLIKDCGDWVEP